MSQHKAAFDICAAMITADTGAGGLNNTASDAHLRGGFARVGDPQRTQGLPYIDFEVAGDRESDAFGRNRVDMVVRFHVWTDRNTAFLSYAGNIQPGNQDTVVAALQTLFHRVTPGAGAGNWNPGMIVRIGGTQAPETDTKLHYVETYSLRLNR